MAALPLRPYKRPVGARLAREAKRQPQAAKRRYTYHNPIDGRAQGALLHARDSGETNLDNLMLLCTRHHTLVHEGGFRIEKDFQDRWSFLRPDGIAVPDFGYSSQDMIDEDLYPKGTWSEVVKIPPAGGILSSGANKVSEPPPPAYLH